MSKQLIESVLTIFSMEEVKIETTSERIPEIVLYLKDGSEIRTKIKKTIMVLVYHGTKITSNTRRNVVRSPIIQRKIEK